MVIKNIMKMIVAKVKSNNLDKRVIMVMMMIIMINNHNKAKSNHLWIMK